MVRSSTQPLREFAKRWLPTLADEIKQSSEGEIRYDSEGSRFAASLEEIDAAASDPAQQISAGDVIWITGGLGGVGWELARRLSQQRKAKVILSGRSPLTDDKRQTLQTLREQGAEIRYSPCDATRSS